MRARPEGSVGLSAADAFHLDVPHDHIGVLWLFDEPLAPSAIDSVLRRALASDPQLDLAFDQRFGCWVPSGLGDPAGLTVHHPRLASERAMLDRLAELYVTPLLGELPPWRALHLPFDGGARSALCFMIHHAYVDGMRGFVLARSVTDAPPLPGRRPKIGRPGVLARLAAAGAMSVRDMVRRRASAVPKREDSGTRRFEIARIAGADLRAAMHRDGAGRTALLATAFAQALGDRFGAGEVALAIPRDGGGLRRGNAFLPEIRRFSRQSGRFHMLADTGGGADLRFAADELRMGAMRMMPRLLRQQAYRRWADGFDALCTILPDLFRGACFAGAPIRSAFGVPPLIWRQPLSCAIIVGLKEATILVASDPQAIEADGLAEAVAAAARG